MCSIGRTNHPVEFPNVQSYLYKFYMKIPGLFPCNIRDSKCGFIVEVTCFSRDNPHQFDIKLVLDKDKYPTDLHCHSLSAADMHFSLEEMGWKDLEEW